MAEQLTLEERIVGHLLVSNGNPIDIDTRFLHDYIYDFKVLVEYYGNKIRYDDEKLLNVKTRNPFLFANCKIVAKELLLRATKRKDYDIKSAVPSIISDNFGLSMDRKHWIEHDRGDNRQFEFVFLHELGIKLGIKEKVEEEVRAYAEAYAKFWEKPMKSRGIFSQAFEQKIKQVNDYNTCLTAEYKKSMQYPLLEQDWKIIEVLASLSSNNLKAYANKYQNTDEVKY